MKFLRLLLLLLIGVGVSELRAQSVREQVTADPGKAGGVYALYTYDNPARTPAPQGYEPFYISHFGRHGSRWMLHNSDYTELQTAFDAAAQANGLTNYGKQVARRVEAICANGIGRAGELSPKGVAQHRDIAERMYAAYPGIFRDSARIEARATVVMRCALSMAAFSERLKELNPALRITRSADLRNTRILNFFSPQANPLVTQEYLDLPKTEAWKEATQAFRDKRLHPERIMQRIFTAAYLPQVKNPQHLMQQLGAARSSLQGLDLDVSLDDLFTPDELYALWECDNYGFYQHRGPSPETRQYPLSLAKVFLEDVLTHADSAIAAGTPAADLRFGHDGNMMTIANLMQLPGCTAVTDDPDRISEVWQNYRVTPMAANIQLVFYRTKNSDEVLVKILHNEHEVLLPLASDLAPFYPWKELKKFYRGIMDGIPDPDLRH